MRTDEILSLPSAETLVGLVFAAVLVRRLDDRVITYWGEGCEQLYGWSRDEAVGRRVDDLLKTRYPAPVDTIEQEVIRQGRWEGKLRRRASNDRRLVVSTRWGIQASDDGSPEIVEVDIDFTRPHSAERRLQETDEIFRLLAATARDYAIFTLDTDGRVTSWNDGAQRLKRYSGPEIIGKHFSVFYMPKDLEAGRPAHNLANAERDGRVEDEGWRVRKDGTRFWASVTITALRDKTGNLRGFGKVTRDLTEKRMEELRRAEEDKRRLDELHQHAERMTQLEKIKRDFLNLASHELRGPLAVLRGYFSMIEDGSLPLARLPQIAPLLSAKLMQMEVLVQQMLDTARLENKQLALRAAVFELTQAVEDVVHHFRPLVPARHTLELVAPGRPAWVYGDRQRIQTVVTNLLDNAIKYSPDGGPVTCTVRATTGQVSVSIRDSGIGIAAGDVSKLFVPFGRIVTPRNAHIGGTGLGLYLAREILRQHGGDITVRSVAGRGSTFRCTLPTVQAESAKNGQTPNEAGVQRPAAGDRGLAATTFRSATKALEG